MRSKAAAYYGIAALRWGHRASEGSHGISEAPSGKEHASKTQTRPGPETKFIVGFSYGYFYVTSQRVRYVRLIMYGSTRVQERTMRTHHT